MSVLLSWWRGWWRKRERVGIVYRSLLSLIGRDPLLSSIPILQYEKDGPTILLRTISSANHRDAEGKAHGDGLK